MKKTFIYILLLLFSAKGSYAFQDATPDIETDVTIADTVYEDTLAEEAASEEYYEEPEYKKREFEADFKQKYKNADYDYSVKKPIDNFFTRFLAKVRAFVRSLFSVKSPGSGSSVFGIITIIKIVILLLVTGAVTIVIIGLVRGNLGGFFGRKNKNTTNEESLAENILHVNFADLVATTENEQNYRLAVRYYYLWLLQRLSNKELIKWHTEKTNSDYYYELKDGNIRAEFKYLSYIYDYIWYGEFDIDNTSYTKAKDAFRKTLNTI